MFRGKLEGIYLAKRHGGLPRKVRQARAVLTPAPGLKGDRYCAAGAARKGGRRRRDVTLIEAEALEALARDYGIALPPHQARRNLVTRGVPLNHLVGAEFFVGEACLRGLTLCEPCGYLEAHSLKGVRNGLIHRGGLLAEVVSEGVLRVDDAIVLRKRWPDKAIARAGRAVSRGDRILALKSLARAESLGPRDDQLLRMAQLYGELKETPRALAMLQALIKRSPRNPGLQIEQADLAMRAGDRVLALRALSRAKALKPEVLDRRRLERLLDQLRAPSHAARNLPPSGKPASKEPPDWIEKAELAAASGRRRSALKHLSRIEAARPDDQARRRVAGLYSKLGAALKALRNLEPLLGRFPREAGLRIDHADAAAKAGRRQSALRSLARAENLDPSPGERHRISLLYQDLREYPRALRILRGLAREHPAVPAYVNSLGLCHHLNGNSREAIRDLRTAVRMDPRSWPAYLNLGAVYASRRSFGEAIALYNQALAAGRGNMTECFRKLMLRSRTEAVSASARDGKPPARSQARTSLLAARRPFA